MDALEICHHLKRGPYSEAHLVSINNGRLTRENSIRLFEGEYIASN